MQDYVAIFGIEEHRDLWEECFRKKYLYREIQLGRASHASMLVNIKFAHRLEEVFKTG